ncbi:MAG: hypothetical protein QNI99_12160 [Woeseiaceae bacterium]|nr:hypothetical protein [Woeseiaceae bacterium]
MKKPFVLILLLVGSLPGAVQAETVDVGGVTLEIPAPDGYTSVSGQPAIFDVWKDNTHSSEILLAGFMSIGDFDEWLEQRNFDYGSFNAFAKVDRALAAMPGNPTFLAAIAEKSSGQLREGLSPAFVEGDGGRRALNRDLSADEVALVSVQTDVRSFSYVVLSNSPAADYPVNAKARVLVRGRIIDLFIEGVYESNDDIAWIQRALAAWVDAVIAANE